MAKQYLEKEILYDVDGEQWRKTIGYYIDENGNEVEKYSIEEQVIEPSDEPTPEPEHEPTTDEVLNKLLGVE